jgi:FHS family glucose/mannose:H+ symporter-like MFS transporter
MLLYGIGQGIVMTSVSLLQSRRYPQDRTARIARLNLVWSIAAVTGPWIVLRSTAQWGVHAALDGVAALFALAACLTFALVRHESVPPSTLDGPKPYRWAAPALLLLIVPLATGIESSAGGWLAAYSKRSGHTYDAAVGVTTCFWAGMLLSRLLQSQRSLSVRMQRAVFVVNPWLLVLAMAAILGSRQEPLMLAGALLLGLAAGPIYPQMLSRVLSYGEGGNTVFILAGCGASLLPLLTGLVSHSTGSLRAGLIVPLLGAITMGCAALLFLRRENQSHVSDERRA